MVDIFEAIKVKVLFLKNFFQQIFKFCKIVGSVNWLINLELKLIFWDTFQNDKKKNEHF